MSFFSRRKQVSIRNDVVRVASSRGRQGPCEASASVMPTVAVMVLLLLIAQARGPAVKGRGMCMYRMPACAPPQHGQSKAAEILEASACKRIIVKVSGQLWSKAMLSEAGSTIFD